MHPGRLVLLLLQQPAGRLLHPADTDSAGPAAAAGPLQAWQTARLPNRLFPGTAASPGNRPRGLPAARPPDVQVPRTYLLHLRQQRYRLQFPGRPGYQELPEERVPGNRFLLAALPSRRAYRLCALRHLLHQRLHEYRRRTAGLPGPDAAPVPVHRLLRPPDLRGRPGNLRLPDAGRRLRLPALRPEQPDLLRGLPRVPASDHRPGPLPGPGPGRKPHDGKAGVETCPSPGPALLGPQHYLHSHAVPLPGLLLRHPGLACLPERISHPGLPGLPPAGLLLRGHGPGRPGPFQWLAPFPALGDRRHPGRSRLVHPAALDRQDLRTGAVPTRIVPEPLPLRESAETAEFPGPAGLRTRPRHRHRRPVPHLPKGPGDLL
ncbi:MAG: hypothetical protein BWY73_01556 [candidate division TA06 bacterium ADurb.Bin417]|uniref:Uncharacterized protein n=1 Tax=candidate division TA06 bacterium ADurb.Bin417 TaxID=1852828 RepID=A0A1V5M7J0_UNCT6|nr:MAG: hypothetical protein BWY73_01556 [candidate division TA06 bacterium ADurb.Bin417]